MTTLDDFVIEVLHDLTQASRTRGFINDHQRGYFDGMADAIEIVGKARKISLEKLVGSVQIERQLLGEVVQCLNDAHVLHEDACRMVGCKLDAHHDARAKTLETVREKYFPESKGRVIDIVRLKRNAEADDAVRWKVKEDE